MTYTKQCECTNYIPDDADRCEWCERPVPLSDITEPLRGVKPNHYDDDLVEEMRAEGKDPYLMDAFKTLLRKKMEESE